MSQLLSYPPFFFSISALLLSAILSGTRDAIGSEQLSRLTRYTALGLLAFGVGARFSAVVMIAPGETPLRPLFLAFAALELPFAMSFPVLVLWSGASVLFNPQHRLHGTDLRRSLVPVMWLILATSTALSIAAVSIGLVRLSSPVGGSLVAASIGLNSGFLVGQMVGRVGTIAVQGAVSLGRRRKLRPSQAVKTAEERGWAPEPFQSDDRTSSLESMISRLHPYVRPESARIIRLLLDKRMGPTAIGVVGLRGVGKTILQQQVVRLFRATQRIAFSVPCPAEQMTEREIMTSVFENLCYAVQTRLRVDYAKDVPALRGAAPRKVTILTPFLPILRVGGALCSGIGAGYLMMSKLLTLSEEVRVGVASVGAATTVTLLELLAWMWRSGRLAPPIVGQLRTRLISKEGKRRARAISNLYSKTHMLLDELKYDIRQTETIHTGFSPWRGFNRGHTTAREIEQRPPTLLSLVSALESYLSDYVTPLYGEVLVVIDELDRVVDSSAVRGFLRSIKTLLHIQDCRFIISVSEDVVESFQAHSVAAKGEADSAFSDLIRLAPLSVAQGVKFLSCGPATLSQGLALAIATLSGGVLRDIDRYLRMTQVPLQGVSLEVFLTLLRKEFDNSMCEFARWYPGLSPREKAFIVETVRSSSTHSPSETLGMLFPSFESLEQHQALSRRDPPSAARAVRLSLEHIIRVEILSQTADLVSQEFMSDTELEHLRRAMAIHTRSPLEALHILGFGQEHSRVVA